MTVADLILLLDTANPNYEVNLDINFTLEDSFTSDPVTKSIYLETLQCPSVQNSQTSLLYA